MQSYPTKRRSTRVYGRSSLSPLFFCNSPLFFYPGRVHVAKSEMPPFQRTIPLYGSRNIWVAWLARLDFSSFPFPPPPFFGLAFYDPSKKTARTSTMSTGNSRVEISNFPWFVKYGYPNRFKLESNLCTRKFLLCFLQNFRKSFLRFTTI